jgi:hypothetical protein
MTELTKSEISVVHGGMAVSEAICTIAEIIHLGSEGFSALKDAISSTLQDCYNKNWKSLASSAIKLVNAGIFLSATAVHLIRLCARGRGHHRRQ